MFQTHRRIVVAMVLAAAPLALAGPPGAATRPSVDPVEARDYCTVLLAVKLQDRLATTAGQQASLGKLKVQLRAYLDNAAGNIRGAAPTPGLIAARGEVVLAQVGSAVRDVLDPSERATLASLYEDGTLKSIEVVAAVASGRRSGRASVTTGISLKYTHFGEASADRSAAASRPSRTTPVTPDNPPTAGPAGDGAAPSPGRLRRAPHVDVGRAVARLQTGSLPEQMVAAAELTRAVPDAARRPAVLAALRPYVDDPGDPHWAKFAVAFCRWSDAPDRSTVQTILSRSDGLRAFDQKQSSSAAACAALLRLDPAGAVTAINARVDDDLFRVHLVDGVRDMAARGGPDEAVADDVLDQLMRHRQGGPPIMLPAAVRPAAGPTPSIRT